MGPKRLPTPPRPQPAADGCCAGLVVRIDHHPQPPSEPALEQDLEEAAPGRRDTLVELADTLHRQHGGSRLSMLAIVLETVTLGIK